MAEVTGGSLQVSVANIPSVQQVEAEVSVNNLAYHVTYLTLQQSSTLEAVHLK